LSAIVRQLRSASEGNAFRLKRARLTEYEARCVKAVIGELRKAESLPGDDDFDDVIPPCIPVWRRFVPNTDLWLFYEPTDDNVHLWTVKRLEGSYGPFG
jgi:hypothetical protein